MEVKVITCICLHHRTSVGCSVKKPAFLVCVKSQGIKAEIFVGQNHSSIRAGLILTRPQNMGKISFLYTLIYSISVLINKKDSPDVKQIAVSKTDNTDLCCYGFIDLIIGLLLSLILNKNCFILNKQYKNTCIYVGLLFATV